MAANPRVREDGWAGLIRPVLAMLALFGAGLCLGLGSALALRAVGRDDLLDRLARWFGSLIAWRMAPGQPAVTGLLIAAGNGAACEFVALTGAAACWLELRLRASGGLLDRFLRVAYARPSALGRVAPLLAGAGPEKPRTGLAICLLLPALCLLTNGLYAGLATGLVAVTPHAGSLAMLLAYAPIECLALALAASLSVAFARAAADARGLREAWAMAHTPARHALVCGLVAVAAAIEAAQIAALAAN